MVMPSYIDQLKKSWNIHLQTAQFISLYITEIFVCLYVCFAWKVTSCNLHLNSHRYILYLHMYFHISTFSDPTCHQYCVACMLHQSDIWCVIQMLWEVQIPCLFYHSDTSIWNDNGRDRTAPMIHRFSQQHIYIAIFHFVTVLLYFSVSVVLAISHSHIYME